ncbi:hypothetical protein ABZP36_019816 [Zizania latifolia]
MGGLSGFGGLLKVSLLRRDAEDDGGLGAAALLCQFEPQPQPDPQLQDILLSKSVSSSNSRWKGEEELCDVEHNA